jgi:uncharacterized protein (DUF1778 family)
MDTLTHKKVGNTRIDIRVSKEDKELFERARDVYGAKTLSEFMRQILHRESRAIIEEKERILASKKDREIFFSALIDDKPRINQSLSAAFKRNKEVFSK